MNLQPDYSSAKKKLDHFIENGLSNYTKLRNYDYGPKKRNNTSCLSPYIKKRIIHEKEVLQTCLKVYKFEAIEKFIQEIFWRTYWKGWLEGRPKVWEDYTKKLNAFENEKNSTNFHKDYLKAINGKTCIECFDTWTQELIEYGYLHNHVRMWYASIWIFTLDLPWELGANFFYNHLLDADAASNTLSWRWVAGLHTPGKYYQAREENIEKFSNFSFNNKKKLNKDIAKPECGFFEYKEKLFENYKWKDVDLFLINPTNLSYSKEFLDKIREKKVLLLDNFNREQNSYKKKNFETLSIDKYEKWLRKNKINIFRMKNEDELKLFLKNSQNVIFTNYPSVGYEKIKIENLSKKYKIKIKYLYDDFDKICWPYANYGFFKFKSKIPIFIEKLY